MTIRLYHATTVDCADSIMRSGFRDNSTRDVYHWAFPDQLVRTIVYPSPSVWFSEVPTIDDELFDGSGLFNGFAEKQTFIAIDMPEFHPDIRLDKEKEVPTWPANKYLGPAAIWNRYPRTRIELDDIIRLRLRAKPAHMRKLKKWIEEREDPRPYGTQFYARVKRILAEFGVSILSPAETTHWRREW